MNINATILVQAFNFFIVYWMIRVLLFKPIVGIIEEQVAHENALHGIINQQKRSLEIQEKERQRYWSTCQEYFSMHRPYLSHKKYSLSDETAYETEITSSLPADAITNIAIDVRSALEEKIKHVH